MEVLRDLTGETVHLGVMAGDHVVYVEKVEARHPVVMRSTIGAIAPLHCTGVAKAILAFLPEDERQRLIGMHELERFTANTMVTPGEVEADLAESRVRGFGRDNQEHAPGIHCVAAPILAGDDEVLGAFSISAPTSRVGTDTLLGFVPALRAAADRTSEQFGWKPA
jgi:DNA-binding IclR family transcriptional regulator